jgi:hypothetical protein
MRETRPSMMAESLTVEGNGQNRIHPEREKELRDSKGICHITKAGKPCSFWPAVCFQVISLL